MSGQANTLQAEIATLGKASMEFRDKYNDMGAFLRRWNLRVNGIPEKTGRIFKKNNKNKPSLTCLAKSPPVLRTRWILRTEWDLALDTNAPVVAS